MSANRYDLMVGRKYTSQGQEKTQWTRVGVMFPSKKGDGFSITLEALPLIFDEKGNGVRIQAFPPKPRDERGGGSRTSGGGFPDEDYGAGSGDDDIGF